MSLLKVSVVKNQGGVITILPKGPVDSDTYLILQKEIDAIFKSLVRTIIFDMQDVGYISSMGINVILGTKEKIEKLGGTLLMINLKPQISKVFEIVRAIPSESIFTSREELDRYLAKIQQKEIEKRRPLQ